MTLATVLRREKRTSNPKLRWKPVFCRLSFDPNIPEGCPLNRKGNGGIAPQGRISMVVLRAKIGNKRTDAILVPVLRADP